MTPLASRSARRSAASMSAALALALVASLLPARAWAGRNSGGLPAGSSIKVLWLGNSLTGATDALGAATGWKPMPDRLVPLLAELGITMTYDSNIIGGSEYSTHRNNSTSMAKIVDPSFDAVNLQATYEGINDAAARYAAVLALYTAAHNAGSAVLLEGIWSIPGGGPDATLETSAIEGAAAQLNANFGAPLAFPAQVSKCWGVIERDSPALMARMHDDSTHQSNLGEYFNTLVYARFFSGRSVAATTYAHALVVAGSTAAERSYMKQVVDACVDYFYDAGTAPTASLTISSPTAGQVIPAGQAVSYQATATDSVSGDLSAAIEWVDGGSVVHTGASFTRTLAAGSYSITAQVTGSDGRRASATRSYRVATPVNQPPTASTATQNVNYNTPFMQIALSGFASDPDGTIDWSTLQLDTTRYHGVSLTQDGQTPSTVNMNYQGTNFRGVDHFSWRVKDNLGAWSNWGSADLVVGVTPPARPRGLRLR